MKLQNNIKVQQQPTNHSCVQACIAMALGLDVNDVIQEFENLGIDISKGTYDRDRDFYLMRYGVAVKEFYIPDCCGLFRGHYFANVPSRNIIGLSHLVLVYISCGEVVVYDPNNGKENKHYYDLDSFPRLPVNTFYKLDDFSDYL